MSVPSGIIGMGVGDFSGLVGVGGPTCLVGVGAGGGVGVVNNSSGLVMGVPFDRSLALLMRSSRDPSFGVGSLFVARTAVGSVVNLLDSMCVDVGLSSETRGVVILGSKSGGVSALGEDSVAGRNEEAGLRLS